MNKRIVLIIAVLLIVAVVFAACKGTGDSEKITESTTESTTKKIVLKPGDDDMDNTIIPDIFVEDLSGEGDIYFGDEEEPKEDSISWNEIVGNNS